MAPNSPTRDGYTKTGKTLRQIRRYYALKDSSKRQKTEEESIKRKRSPDDEKLSKRIAAELKVQQDANEKRYAQQRSNESPTSPPPSALPAPIVKRAEKDGGPVFIAEPLSTEAKSVKSAKSVKNDQAPERQLPSRYIESPDIGRFAFVISIICLTLAVTYTLAWIIVMASSDQVSYNLKEGPEHRTNWKTLRWVGATSLILIVIIPIWYIQRSRFKISMLTLIGMTVCILSYTICYVITIVEFVRHKDQVVPYHLLIILTVVYTISILMVFTFMVKHVISLLRTRIDERSHETEGHHWSQYLSPK